MTTYYTEVDSPLQPILLTSDGAALTGLFTVSHRGGPEVAPNWVRDDQTAPFPEAARQLTAYFAGHLTAFDLPLSVSGTVFQQKVWEELRRVPHGTTVSYGELARRIGRPTACRAVGLANGRNPISIIVPCHRVVGVNGKLVGYAGGLSQKEALLRLERLSNLLP